MPFIRLPLTPRRTQKTSRPNSRKVRRTSNLHPNPRPTAIQPPSQPTAPRVIPTLPRQPMSFPLAAWSCPRPGLVRSTRRPSWFLPPPPRALETRPPAFSAASRSLIAGHRAAPAAIRSAPPPVPRRRPAKSQADRGPNIPHVPPQAAMPDPADLAPAVPARGLVLERPGRVVLAVRAPVPAERPQPAKLRLARNVPLPGAVADARNIPRPRKAQ